MSNHARQRLRSAIQTVLNAQSGLAGLVYVNRIDPFQETDLPAIVLTVSGGPIEYETMGGNRIQSRRLDAEIDFIAKLDSNYDAALEDLATTAEKALATTPLGIPVRDFTLISDAKGRPNGDGQSNLMMLRLIYQGFVQTLESDPETLL